MDFTTGNPSLQVPLAAWPRRAGEAKIMLKNSFPHGAAVTFSVSEDLSRTWDIILLQRAYSLQKDVKQWNRIKLTEKDSSLTHWRHF